MPDSERPHDESVDRVLRAAAYVEEHIHEAVTVRQMAEVACYSLFHFCRMFNRIAWLSPYDYGMRRRLSTAALRVVPANGQRITEIALEHGFDSPDGFTRAFRRMFGISPSDARGSETLDRRRLLDPLDESAAETLLVCRVAGKAVRDADTVLTVRAIADVKEIPETTDTWIGAHCSAPHSGAIQLFCGEALSDGDSDNHPFQVTVPSGQYLEIAVGPDASGIQTLIDRAWSTLWPRMGSASPPTQLLFNRRADKTRMLLQFCP